MLEDKVLIVDVRPAGNTSGCTAINVSGPLVLHTAGEMRHVLHEALAGAVRRLDIDLSGVTDVDPAGLATLVIAARRLQARPDGHALQLTAVSRVCASTMRRLHLFPQQLAAIAHQQNVSRRSDAR